MQMDADKTFTIKWIKKDFSTGDSFVLFEEINKIFLADTPKLPKGSKVKVRTNGDRISLEGLDEYAKECTDFYHATADFLSQHAIDSVVNTVSNPATIYKNNPFILLKFPTKEPLKTTRLCTLKDIMRHAPLDKDTTMYEEMSATIDSVLRQNESMGNTFMSEQDLFSAVKERYASGNRSTVKNIKKCFDIVVDVAKDEIFYDASSFDTPIVARKDTYEAELSLAKAIRKATMANQTPAFPGYIFDDELSEEQNIAIKGTLENLSALCVITGGPGTGKTTLINAMISFCAFHNPGAKLAVLAPTGKASRRDAEAMGETSSLATLSTVHRFIGYGRRNRGPAYENAAAHDLIIIDEASMLTPDIFEDLATLLDFKKTKIVLIGDVNQLESVEAGSLLADVISMGAPLFALKENHRNKNSVDENAEKILTGNPDLIFDKNFQLYDKPTEEILRLTYAEYKAFLNNSESMAILTPFAKESILTSSKNIGVMFQRALLGDTKAKGILSIIPYGDFCIGDSVVMSKTSYRNGYVNGSNGKIVGYNGDKREYEVLIDGDIVSVPFDDTMGSDPSMMLGYATTVHKAQGSEYDEVVIILQDYTPFFTRRLLYTAVTRAKQRVIIMGSKNTLDKIISNTKESERRTLSQKILQNISKTKML